MPPTMAEQESERIGLFGYASLVDPASAALTLGRPVRQVWPARLPGWCRRFSQARDNRRCEKTFARVDDGTVPERILGLNIERCEDRGRAPNGVLIEVSAAELDRLDLRELRYDRVEVTDQVERAPDAPRLDRVVAYTAKSAHLAVEPPEGAVIIAGYAEAVERAFATLGEDELARYRQTTLPYPVEVVEATLVADRIPPGNPRGW